MSIIFFFSKFDPEKFLWAFYYFFQILKKVNHEKNFRGVKRFPGLLTFNWFYLISLRTPRARSKAIKTEKFNRFFGVSLERFFNQTPSAARLVPCGDALAYRENCLIAILTRVCFSAPQKCYRLIYI